MASGLTPTYSLPYPLATDGVNVHGDVEDLAQKVEDILESKANLFTANTFTNVNSILVDTSTTAFKITQTGTGNLFLVENAASPDPTPFIINAQGAVGINVLVPQATLHVAGELLVTGEANFESSLAATDGIFSANVIAAAEVGGNSIFSETNYRYLDAFTGQTMNINKPATIFEDRTISFPDVDGTVITTGNLVEAYPTQTGNEGRVLTTDGSVVSWSVAPNQVPDVAENAGKFLSTDGSTYYWEDIVLVPDISTDPVTGTTGKWLTNTGSSPFWDFLPGQVAFIDINSNFTATGNANLFCDTLTNGAFTITLPTSPLPGMTVAVFDVKNNFVNDYVIIDSGPVLLNGRPGPLNIDVSGATVVFIYINELIGWRLA
jgi:hypothetical protein